MAARKAASRPRTTRARRRAKPTAPRKRAAGRGKRAPRPVAGRARAAKRPASSRKTARPRTASRRKAPVRKARATKPVRKPPVRKKTPARKAAPPARRPAPPAVRRPSARVAAGKSVVAGTKKKAKLRPAPSTPRPATPPALTRERKQLVEADWEPEGAAERRLAASARTGSAEILELLGQHHETSPTLTAGDVDAKWTDAYAVGDEAPGGDNPTPDQDRVDDIGRALGVSYEDNEELRGSDKIIERDRHRWELDPASSDDWPHNRD